MVDDETVAKVAHDSCMQHWGAKHCAACNKATNTKKAVREKLTYQRRDPPGTVLAARQGFCRCCDGPYTTGEKIAQRGFSYVHLRCYVHFVKTPCPKCGGEAAAF